MSNCGQLIAAIADIFKLASAYTDVFETLIIAYQQIGEALPRFDRLQKTFEDNPDFQNVLALVYADILEFHRRAYKFFRRRCKALYFAQVQIRILINLFRLAHIL